MKTLEEIYMLEPALRDLRAAIPWLINQPNNAAVQFWGNWSGIKMMFSQLVGWEARLGALRSSQDYDTIYRHFLAEAERACPETPEAIEE